MAKTTISWKYDSSAGDGFHIYRDDSPMDPENLPSPLATVTIDKREYNDETVVPDSKYYYRVSSYVGAMESVSTELEHVAEASGDEHWDKVVSLLHFDGDFTDETGGVVTTGGALSFTSGKFSEAVRFTRSAAPRTLIRKGGLDIGSGDFTVECYIKLENLSRNNTIFDFRLGTGTSPLPLVESDSGNLYVWVNGAYIIGPAALVMSSSEYKHLALVRESGVLYLWLDGSLIGYAEYTYDMGAAVLTIGMSMNVSSGNTDFDLVGDIDELRITKGVARYTENFTPPTEPFPNN